MWTPIQDIARTYTVNGLNQYLSAGPASFAYDANGNLTSDGTSAYVYDAENRLVSSSASGGTTLSYDPLGRLWKIWSQQTGTTSFVYEGDHVSAEYGGTGTMARRYFWGPGADEPIIQDEGGALNCGGTRFLHANHQGSIIAASNCDGNLTAINRYDEYGIPQGTWGRFQYTGQAWLPELGMYYYKARIYSATLGRFLQTDPIGYDDQVNLYAYVGNDPVNKTDPTGLSCQTDKDGRPTSCKIDNVVLPKGQTSLTPRLTAQVARFEKNYTRAVQRAFDNNRTVRVGETGGRNGTSFRVTGKEVAASLSARTVTYSAGQVRGNAGITTGGNPVTQRIFSNVYDLELGQPDARQQQDIAHDGIHSTLSEMLGNRLSPVLGIDPYNKEHQDPYNDAAKNLLNPR